MDDPIHRAGREAARQGLPLSSCPYLQAANMPGHTGDATHVWRAKLASWEAGWRQECEARVAGLAPRKHHGGTSRA